MPDRLEDLRRQRALVQEQLAWLDREIAAQVPSPLPSHAPQPTPAPAAMPQAVPLTPEPLPDLSRYEADAVATQAETRRGCLLYAGAGVAFIFVLLAALYFFKYRDHPLFFADRPADHAAGEKPPPAARPFK